MHRVSIGCGCPGVSEILHVALINTDNKEIKGEGDAIHWNAID